eukprot:CAMPEP_0184356302 /NCGR_PEP_ID=MMETSP1089-20130417/101856_1 /TAXON_ID=38269 ORGANISM="Gloeochaete wittrockiana, Strain SAG46.84" /NCGR_SAMPLE_ID=MMETSP1089 /ASSEMBLY_ACC=CAM_ASM_000445 /LENGTH=66 /DNA_ID=CAMNT_0026693457 /DNA_START=15 /DNA_END=212 /DNA_ORIENTATION=-
MTGAINYYRAFHLTSQEAQQDPTVRKIYQEKLTTPVKIIWGEQDKYLGIDLTHGLDAHLSNYSVTY